MGPLSAGIMVGGTLLNGFMNRGAAAKANARNAKMQDPVYQVKRYEKAGLNPGVFMMGQQSFAPTQQAYFDDTISSIGGTLADALTSDPAKDLEKTALQQELQATKKAADEAIRAAQAPASAFRRRGGAMPSDGDVNTDMGIVPLEDVRIPTPITEQGTIDLSVNDGGTGATLSPRQDVVTSNGRTTQVTIGPDFDEWLSGQVIEFGQFMGDRFRSANAERVRQQNADRVMRDGDVMWPYELGNPPAGWDDWPYAKKVQHIRDNSTFTNF